MKRAIIQEFEHVGDNLSTLSAQFAYRLMNLCVKAEEVSLLPIEVMIEGEYEKLEDCTSIAKDDDYSFSIFPNFEEDIPALAQAIFQVHPEFKQEMKTMTMENIPDGKGNHKDVELRYLLVTMPEVNDDRYDVLKDGVKALYEECKTEMSAVNSAADVKFAKLLVGESPEDHQQLSEAREAQTKQWYEQRDKIYNEKIQEIEEAYKNWLAKVEGKSRV